MCSVIIYHNRKSLDFKCPLLTWWHVISRAVHTKNPDMVCAVEVMRKKGSSGVTRGVSGAKDALDIGGAAEEGRPLGEPFPKSSERRFSRHQSWLICRKQGGEEFINIYASFETKNKSTRRFDVRIICRTSCLGLWSQNKSLHLHRSAMT